MKIKKKIVKIVENFVYGSNTNERYGSYKIIYFFKALKN